MRAAVVRSFGGPEALEFMETATPEPRAGQVRVRIEAAAVNPVDPATVAGILHQVGRAPEHKEIGVGWDLAGTVEAVGPGVTGYAVGDAVVGILDRAGAPRGSFATHTIVDAAALAKAPTSVTSVEASTIPLPGLTALQALDRLGLVAGQSLLVTGAAGGLGAYAAQLAAGRGIEVVAQAGPGDEEFLRSIGVRHVVPRGEDLGEAVRELYPSGVDGVIDAAVQGIAAFDAVRNGGAFANVLGELPSAMRNIDVHGILVHADQAGLETLVSLVDSGGLTLRVAETYPLDEVAVALERFAKGGLRGRLVLLP